MVSEYHIWIMLPLGSLLLPESGVFVATAQSKGKVGE
jgi:hypothetical protein